MNHNTTTKQRTDKKSDNFYTPITIRERTIQALGAIDLDPCADPRKSVPAAKHFTFDDDGLSREWYGRVFMNPPYSKPAPWVAKLEKEYCARRVREAIALLPASTDTRWLSPLLRENLVCFWRGRLRFIDGVTYQPAKHCARESHVLVYWGARAKCFIDAFQDVASFPNAYLFENIDSMAQEIKALKSKICALTNPQGLHLLDGTVKKTRKHGAGSGWIVVVDGKKYFRWEEKDGKERKVKTKRIQEWQLKQVEELNQQKAEVRKILKVLGLL